MKIKNTLSFIAASLLSLLLFNVTAFSESGKNDFPKTQGWQEPLEYIIGGFPVWEHDGSSINLDSNGIRIYMYSTTKDAPNWISNWRHDWRKDLRSKENGVVELFISDSVLRSFTNNARGMSRDSAGVYPGAALILYAHPPLYSHVVADYPNSREGYSVTPFSWMRRKFVISGYTGSNVDAENRSTSYASIVAGYDKTRVTFTCGGLGNGYVLTKSGKKLTAGMSDTVLLDREDVWIIPAQGENPDLSGSFIIANKPIACFSGVSRAQIPAGSGPAEFITDQEIPWEFWDEKYYVTPIKERYSNSLIRLYSFDSSTTTIYRDGWEEQIAIISGFGGKKGEAWAEVRTAEGEPRAVTLLSEKRFYATQYNSGQDENGAPSHPFQMPLLSNYFFGNFIGVATAYHTAGKASRNYLNVIYQASKLDGISKLLQVGELVNDSVIAWTPLSERFGEELGYEFTDPTKPNPDKSFYCKQIELPANKIFYIRNTELFAAYAYGYSEAGGYGFPIMPKDYWEGPGDEESPYVFYTIDSLGNVPDPATGQPAYVKDMPDDSLYRSNLGVLYFDKNESYNYVFDHEPFVPGGDRYAEWSLKPINPNLGARAVITFTDRAGNDTTVVIESSGPILLIEPKKHYFGEVEPGIIDTVVFKLINASTDGATLKPGIPLLLKGDQGFSIDYNYDPEIPLAPGESREFNVIFEGRISEEDYRDTIGIGEGKYFLYSATVYAKGAEPKIYIYVDDASFGVVPINTTKSWKGTTIHNGSSSPLVIIGYKGPTLEEFKVSLYNWGISSETPLILQPGQEVSFTSSFTPRENREYLDSIVFDVKEGSNYDNVCYLSGYGIDSAISVHEDYRANSQGCLLIRIFPNPLDSRGGALEFENPGDGNVEIVLFNSLNQQVAILQSGWMKAGKQSIRIPIESLPSGAYTYRITAGKIAVNGNLIISK